MVKKLLVPFASAFACMLTFVGTASVSSFKLFLLYEPDVPESLKN